MVKPTLKNRKHLGSTLENNLWDRFHELSKETRIDKSRLLDEAIEDLLKKYKKGE